MKKMIFLNPAKVTLRVLAFLKRVKMYKLEVTCINWEKDQLTFYCTTQKRKN